MSGNLTITFSRDNEVFTLGGGSEDIIHLSGLKGFGVPPTTISMFDRVVQDGSILKRVRYDSRELFIPLLIRKETLADCTKARDDLYNFLAPDRGPIEVTVNDPSVGVTRTITAIYQKGLEGDFGENYNATWQTIGLTLLCPDPWWRGNQKLISLSPAPGVKDFLSDTVPFFPIILAQSSVQDRFIVDIAGSGEVTPTWQITGPGEDLMISNGQETFKVNHRLRDGETLTIDTARRRLSPDVWEKVPLSSRMFTLKPGANHLHITMTGATSDTRVNLVYAERFRGAI